MFGSRARPDGPPSVEDLSAHPRSPGSIPGSRAHPSEPPSMEDLSAHPRSPGTSGNRGGLNEPPSMEDLSSHSRIANSSGSCAGSEPPSMEDLSGPYGRRRPGPPISATSADRPSADDVRRVLHSRRKTAEETAQRSGNISSQHNLSRATGTMPGSAPAPGHSEFESRFQLEIECVHQTIGVLKNELENQKQEYRQEIERLRNFLHSTVESVRTEMAAAVKSVKNPESMGSAQLHGISLASKDELNQLQGQCEVFHARLANVELSMHNSFLDQLKRDAEIIPHHILDCGPKPKAHTGALDKALHMVPDALQSSQDSVVESRLEAIYSMAQSAQMSVQEVQAGPRGANVVASAFASQPSLQPGSANTNLLGHSLGQKQVQLDQFESGASILGGHPKDTLDAGHR